MKFRFKFLFFIIVAFIASACINPRHIFFHNYKYVEQNRKIENIRVALVLGAGGTRGIAHVGVLEVLEKHNIPVDLIVGTSAGSIIGALYADSLSARDVKKKVIKLKKWDLLDPSVRNALSLASTTSGLVEGKRMQTFLSKNLSIKNFEQAKIPTVIVATDIVKQEAFIFNKGPIIPAIMASSAIPPVIPPVEIYNRALVDGGVIEPVPVRTAKKYKPKVIIAVDISEPPSRNLPSNTIWLTYWALWTSYNELASYQGKMADVLIKPKLEGFGMFNDNEIEKLYLLGKEAAEKQVAAIKVHLKAHGIE
ncbi:MAG: patatin-like phospholipase family protein [Sphingobacteriia bacterium]|nr:patatin-like phospholipase family protein [Sphingobacteriia bacterium]